MQERLIKIRDHFARHRGKYAFVAGITTMILLNREAMRNWDDFLEKHDLFDAFYQPEE